LLGKQLLYKGIHVMLKRWLLVWAVSVWMIGSVGAQAAQELKVYKLLASIVQLPKGAEDNGSGAALTVQAMAQGAMGQLEQLTQHFAEAPLASAAMVHDFFTLCNQVPVQAINDMRSRHLRSMADAVAAFNERYGSSRALAATRDVMQRGLVLALVQWNRNVLFCLTVAHDQVADATDAITDTIFYRPCAFMAEHKGLMVALVAAVVVGGVVYYYYRTHDGTYTPEKSASTAAGAVGLSAVAPATWAHDAPLAGITLVRGDITQQTFGTEQARAAIVNAANTACLGGGGIDGAIHAAAGSGLVQECRQIPVDNNGVRCPVGEARLTGGHALAPLRIIHTVGPDTRVPEQNANRQVLLANAYRNSLLVAQQAGILYVAFPCISTAIFGYDVQEAAQVALDTITIFLRDNPGAIHEVRLVTFSPNDFAVYAQQLQNRFGAEVDVRPVTLRNGAQAAVHCFRFRPYVKRGG
jgi:O-acetyl-ADP-ribose deacetylase (regulator of RNase III)